jgi:uncharacterized coiled-coil DUF342 family protein
LNEQHSQQLSTLESLQASTSSLSAQRDDLSAQVQQLEDICAEHVRAKSQRKSQAVQQRQMLTQTKRNLMGTRFFQSRQ